MVSYEKNRILIGATTKRTYYLVLGLCALDQDCAHCHMCDKDELKNRSFICILEPGEYRLLKIEDLPFEVPFQEGSQ